MEATKKKKKLEFPTAITVLFIVLIFAAILTVVVPAGLYSKLSYNADSDKFEVTDPSGEITEMEPTQATLDELGVTGNLDKFLDGSISKPVAIPGTYEKVEQAPQGIFDILLAPISGVYDTIDIILFVFILGGCIGVLNHMGAFNAAIAVLSKITKGKEYILILNYSWISIRPNNCTMSSKIDSGSSNYSEIICQKGIKSLWQFLEELFSCQGSLIVAIPAVHTVC